MKCFSKAALVCHLALCHFCSSENEPGSTASDGVSHPQPQVLVLPVILGDYGTFGPSDIVVPSIQMRRVLAFDESRGVKPYCMKNVMQDLVEARKTICNS